MIIKPEKNFSKNVFVNEMDGPMLLSVYWWLNVTLFTNISK